MARHKDLRVTTKIFALKQAGQSTEAIATRLGLNPETVRRHVRSTEFQSLAHDMAKVYRGNLTQEIEKVHQVTMEVLGMRVRVPGGKDGETRPHPQAISLAKALAVTQTGRMMSTKAAERQIDDESLEEKQKLFNELMNLKTIDAVVAEPGFPVQDIAPPTPAEPQSEVTSCEVQTS